MAKIIEFKNKYKVGVHSVLMLNPMKAGKFQCGGFFVGSKCPTGVVTENTDLVSIERALADETLIDVTNNAVTKAGVSFKDTSTSPILVKDTGLKAFQKRQSDGSILFIVPKDEADRDRIELEILTTGTFTHEPVEVSISEPAVIESRIITDITPKRKPSKIII